MGHPMDGYYDDERDARDRLWARRDVVEARISKHSLADFTAGQFADLQLLYDRKAPSERKQALVEALERLEEWLKVRSDQ